MRILAIDPAKLCGWAYYGSAAIASGTWDLSIKKDESAGMKLLKLESKLVHILRENGVDLIVYETPAQYSAYPLALISHAKFIGVLERFSVRHLIESKGFSPSAIKKFATGKGNAKKAGMIDAVRKRWGVVCDDDNEADAYCLLKLALSEYGEEPGAVAP